MSVHQRECKQVKDQSSSSKQHVTAKKYVTGRTTTEDQMGTMTTNHENFGNVNWGKSVCVRWSPLPPQKAQRSYSPQA